MQGLSQKQCPMVSNLAKVKGEGMEQRAPQYCFATLYVFSRQARKRQLRLCLHLPTFHPLTCRVRFSTSALHSHNQGEVEQTSNPKE
mmetsp:Transcript_118/g.122  ORF Transcript_118/g.122 Transcript_118/m.122 type:complete len:87 (+) Transcript_118:383-643(+)